MHPDGFCGQPFPRDKLGHGESLDWNFGVGLGQSPPTLVVSSASAAAAAARDPSPQKIGQLLGVHYLLTGRVQRDGETVHLATQFVRTDNGSVLWSERFDYPKLADWAWQRDVSLRVARSLDLHLTAAVGHSTGPLNARMDVADAAMRGHYLMRHSDSRADVLEARAAFEAALALDPDSVTSLTGLALSYMSQVLGRWSPDPVGQTDKAFQAVQRALALDPDYLVARYALGNIQIFRGEMEDALASYRMVLAVNPSDAWAWARIGWVMLLTGHPADVFVPIEHARRLNPLEGTQIAFGQVVAAFAQLILGNDDDALARAHVGVAADPRSPQAWAMIASLEATHGRAAQAAEAITQVRKFRPEWTVASMRATSPLRKIPQYAGALDRYYGSLRLAGLPD